jgi:hypothetical protein
MSPHVNVGYQWNGDSILGGEPADGQASDLPDVAMYTAGAVIEVHPRDSGHVPLRMAESVESPAHGIIAPCGLP